MEINTSEELSTGSDPKAVPLRIRYIISPYIPRAKKKNFWFQHAIVTEKNSRPCYVRKNDIPKEAPKKNICFRRRNNYSSEFWKRSIFGTQRSLAPKFSEIFFRKKWYTYRYSIVVRTIWQRIFHSAGASWNIQRYTIRLRLMVYLPYSSAHYTISLTYIYIFPGKHDS